MTRWRLSAIPATLLCAALMAACAAVPSPSLSALPSTTARASGLAISSTGPSASSGLLTSQPPGTTFPSVVAGLPVISVANADELLESDKLDGQAVAVAGYYDESSLPCPYPGRYIGPLESWCRFVAFTDTRAGAQLCQSSGTSGVSCSQPSGTNLAPFFVGETSGNVSSWLNGGPTDEPAAFVVIGHAGDARQWQCTAATQTECARAFVVDRIAWADGRDVPPAAPQTGDQRTGKAIVPRMTLAQVAAAIGLGDDLLTGAAFRAGDIATVDPRWNLAGDNLVWLVRSLGPAAGPAAGSDAQDTRPEVVWLVDDVTGRVIDSHPLQLAADYQPARLWQMATAHGVDCCSGAVAAFYGVNSGDGTVVFEGPVPGDSSGGQGFSTYGGGYGSGPLVLPAGGYSISAWLATNNGGVAGAPRDECSTQVTLRPLDDVALNADYPLNRACSFQPVPSPSP